MPNINSITYSELKQVINSILSDNLIQRMFNISHPIGSLHLSFDDRSPDKYLEGGGSSSWQRIAAGKCLFGTDSDNKTGTEIEAGLPNITGWARGDTFNNGNTGSPIYWAAGGAITIGSNTEPSGVASYQSSGAYMKSSDFVFNASNSNPIYGKSNTVQPPALMVNIWKRIS